MDKINIAFACNDNYLQHCGVAMCSLLENTRNPRRINFYLIDGGINFQNKKILKNFINKYGAKLNFLKIDLSKHLYYQINNYGGDICFKRAYLPFVLKEKKILYLDCDIIVLGDIENLYNTKIKDCLLAVSEGKKLHKSRYNDLALKPYEEYFNSGVLLMDLKKMKKINFIKKFENYVMTKNPPFPDQDALNHSMRGRWHKLSLLWNVMSSIYSPSFYKEYLDYSDEEVRIARKNPKIIHYCSDKPWFFKTIHPLKKEYWKYLKKTPWKNYKYPDKDISSLVKKIIVYIRMRLPYKLRKLIKNYIQNMEQIKK